MLPSAQADTEGPESRRIQELEALYAVSAAMNQALTEKEGLEQALSRVLAVLALESGRIYLLDETSGELRLVSAAGNPLFLDPNEATISPGECLCGEALASGKPLVTTDLASDPRIKRPGCRQHSQHACAAIPLLSKERMLGVLHVASRRQAALTGTDVALLRSVGAQIGVALENMRLREDARRADTLTTLIAEMHHRIKNNLQTVADLLSLEMLSSQSPEARRSLHDSINRIKSIAAVHRLLSSEQLRLTDITELARQVCDVSLGHLTRPDRPVKAEIEGPPIYLPSKQATALALIINELIANALEHSIGDRVDCHLFIRLAQEGPLVTVMIADDGAGLPPGFDLQHSKGLGLSIVQTLVEKDLGGSLTHDVRPGGGSQARLTFFR